jgi:hypothetical protein
MLAASFSIQLKDLSIYNDFPRGSEYRIAPEPLLTSVTSLSLDCTYWGFELSDLKALTQLKELRLNSKFRINISLNSIVTKLPKDINSLSLESAEIGINGLELVTHSNISCLKLCDSIMDDTDTSTFLTLYFQKLKSLTLYKCKLPSLIDLPNHHLDFFEYSSNQFTLTGSTGYQLTLSDRTYCFTLGPHFVCSIYDSTTMEKTDRSVQQVMRPSEKQNQSTLFPLSLCKPKNSVLWLLLFIPLNFNLIYQKKKITFNSLLKIKSLF